MVLFALSFQGQVEKYGAYVGIAAFFGLAILSLLYFAQARELKRLREWAGRAPERARELEQRVVAQASAGVAPRGPATPAKGGVAPPRRLAEMPAPPAAAAQAAASAQATELADAVPAEDEPATNGNVPAAPGAGAAAAAVGANGAVPPVEDAEAADGASPAEREAAEAAQSGTGLPAETGAGQAGGEEAEEKRADQAEGEEAEEKRADLAEGEQADVTTAQPAGDERAAGAESTAAGAAGAAAAGAAGAAAGAAGPTARAGDGDRDASAAGPAAGAAASAVGPTARAGDGDRDASAAGAGTAGGLDEQDAPAAGGAGTPGAGGEAAADAPDPQAERAPATRPGEVPPLPRATPAQRVGVTPRPAPMPLRQAKPSATPASGRGGGPGRPGAAATRRPAGAPREGRSAGTIALFVGLAILILGGGAFVVSQLGGDDTPPAPNQTAPPPTVPETGGGGGRSGDPAKTAAETNVAVLNGTTFTGLAGQLADRVTQEGGYQRGAVETNTRDQTLQTSTIYYAEGFRSQARRVGELLSISSFEPLDADTQALAPDADVVVLAGADQAP